MLLRCMHALIFGFIESAIDFSMLVRTLRRLQLTGFVRVF